MIFGGWRRRPEKEDGCGAYWRSPCCWMVTRARLAAVANGMTRQTLRDWVHRFNADGVTGLRSRASPGRPPALNETRREELKSIVLEGPDPERHRVVRWRRIDLCEEVAARWSVTVCEQTMGKWLRQLGMTRLQPRPYHPKKDLEAEVAFKKTSPAW